MFNYIQTYIRKYSIYIDYEIVFICLLGVPGCSA